MSAYGGAVMLGTGELKFRPQSFSFCGHCDNYFLMCTCKDIPVARDYNFKSLPLPPEDSTPSMLLRRWCSCVNQSMSMGCFAALQWFRDHADRKLAAMRAKAEVMHQMVEEYVVKLPTDPALPLLMKALGLKPGVPAADGANRVAREARTAAAAFIAGDWNCVTRLGALLLNNAFQSSDADRYPLSDDLLTECFCAVDVLNKILGMGYSDLGWCLAIENDRPPQGLLPPMPGASARLKELDLLVPSSRRSPDLSQTPFAGVGKSLSGGGSSASGACRCGSLTHKRTNHSSCPLNPKKAQRRS